MRELIEKIEIRVNETPDKTSYLRNILSFIDLTTLEGTDNTMVINRLCQKARALKSDDGDIPGVAAVCVYPIFIKQAKENLDGRDIQIASVAGAFPSGQSPLEVRLKEVDYAVKVGADEIDMVISRGRLLEGDEKYIYNEVKSTKEVCGEKHLKVILETGELQTKELITRASQIAIDAGADFIKTSTGKIKPAATLEAVYYMCNVIKKHHEKTGKKIGIKPAGGISDTITALKYYFMVEETLGEEWLNNELFRIGASRLADKVFEALS